MPESAATLLHRCRGSPWERWNQSSLALTSWINGCRRLPLQPHGWQWPSLLESSSTSEYWASCTARCRKRAIYGFFYTVVLRVCPVFLLVLSWLCLYLPISKDMRLPKIRTKWGAGSQAYWRLVAGDCFGACGSFLEVVIVSSLVKQHTRESGAEGHGFFLRAGFLCGATTLALCLLMSYRHGGGSLLVMSLALLNVPFLVLGGPLVAVADALAGSHLESLLTIALVGNFVKQMAESIVKMRVLPSRWSFITYQAHANLMIHTIASLSPLVLIGATQALAHIAPLVAPGLISSDSTLQDIVDSAEGVTVFAVGAPFAFAKFFYQLPAICDLVDERFVLPFPIRGASLHQ
mmetsp:Transcript_21551/g.49312  ORF Transcript_21551/g.49312 Transcript_21551/m.49312 type:complete len:349 (-) Transcript_21551:106-1152(-)